MSNRYFIYLTPIGAIAATLFTAEVWGMTARKLWWRIGLFIFAGGLLALRLHWSWILARSFYGV
ncbi:MAG: hypothetical protein KBB83_08565 [Alphaproteobacteria bacterium]|nr:hypothetical protein [Alphaproteobacteria bacterium]